MLVYEPHEKIDDSQLIDLGAPSDLGGTVISGNPRISARIDYQSGNITGGIFEATTGVVQIFFPFTEHATIIEGEVTITDADGRTHRYKAGDSYLIEQGQTVRWEVSVHRVRKSFMNIRLP